MKIVIVGAGYAGVACATRLARGAREAGQAVEITLINPNDDFVERIRLHQQAAGQPLPRHSLARLLAGSGVRLRLASVDQIGAGTLRAGMQELAWDRLVLALGSRAGRADAPGAEGQVHTLQADDVARWAPRLQALPPGARVLVVGGGLTGVETATEIQAAYPRLRVQLISRRPIADGWSAAAREHLLQCFDRLALDWHEGVDVQAVQPGRLWSSSGEWPFDLCLWTAGFAMPRLPAASGLAVNPAGQVLVDPQLRSISQPEAYAAGDIAAPVLDPGHPLPMGCKSALPSGAHVADNLLRELRGATPLEFDYALPFYCVSLGRDDGLIQWPDEQGRLLGPVLVGADAARFKERVCQTTWRWLVEEADGIEAVQWKRTGRAPKALATAPLAAPALPSPASQP